MLVVDTSAALDVLAGQAPDPRLVARLAEDGDLHAPHLVDVEFLGGLRRLWEAGELDEGRAEDARADWAQLAIVRYPHEGLVERIWQLRHNLTAYDAAFVALAEELGAPLVTCDSLLGDAPGHRAVVEVYGPGGASAEL